MSKEKNLAKRKMKFEHTSLNLKRIEAEVAVGGDYVPPLTISYLEVAQEKQKLAHLKINGEDGESHVNAFVSAVENLTHENTISGLKANIGGERGRNSPFKSSRDDDLLQAMQGWMRRNPDRSHGWKSKLARNLENNKDLNFEAARKFVYRNLHKLE
ncbi:MAG: hypothetical protein O3B41_12205 [Bacteroidetes bacterium]|nr:hypothetical protein [Bacteroidota bacterium]